MFVLQAITCEVVLKSKPKQKSVNLLPSSFSHYQYPSASLWCSEAAGMFPVLIYTQSLIHKRNTRPDSCLIFHILPVQEKHMKGHCYGARDLKVIVFCLSESSVFLLMLFSF